MTEVPQRRIRPGAFRRAEQGEGGTDDAEQLIWLLDVQERSPGIVRLRDWAFTRLAPRAGETALDIGAGTGAETRRLAAAVGSAGRAVGIEPHPVIRAEAQRRAAADGAPARFVNGDAASLPLADASVDLVRCERVFQHLPDPRAAVSEIARVLRPGGRVAVLDTDWATMVLHPGDPDVLRRFNAAFCRGFAEPYAGRRLRSWLTTAGLAVDPDIGSAAVVLPDEQLASGPFVASGVEQAVEQQAITRDEADEVLRGLAGAVARHEAFCAVTMFAAVARKPG